MIPFNDLKIQYEELKPKIHDKINRVLEHGQYIMGPEVSELEEKLADYVGVKHCITVSSGTDSLLIAMMALGIGAGDEVITTPFTFISAGEMIALLGARPIFIDIDPMTFNIDPKKIEKAITSNTRAIIPVSLYGQCADMEAINCIAAKYDVCVIEDAAQSFGATQNGRKSCSLTTIGSTSFFPSKPLGGYGDGGALFTNDDNIATTMREIRTHGQSRRYHHQRIGINGRLDTLQAAILLIKLERFPIEVKKREAAGNRYTQILSGVSDNFIIPHIAKINTSVYAQYTLRVKNREYFVDELKKRDIPTAIHYPTILPLQPAFSHYGYIKGDFPMAEQAASEVVSLPMGPDLNELDQDKVINSIIEIYS